MWLDYDGDGVYEPSATVPEITVNGVVVNLRLASDDSLVDTTTTAGGGLYLFTDLVPGTDYYVEIPASEFEAGEPLEGLFSSTGALSVDSGAADGTDKGRDPIVLYDAVISGVFTAEPGSEPTTDGTGDNPDNDAVRPDDSEDLTVDFGFYGLELGGNVFEDLTNNGQDNGDGYFDAVTLLLYYSDGSPFLREDGSHASTTTNSSGDYVFTGLPAGSYFVEIPASQFASTGPLEGYGSSDGNDDVSDLAPDPENNLTGEDNGNPVGGDVFAGSAVRSGIAILSAAAEVTTDPAPTAGTPDTNSNLTVDFGFWKVNAGLELGNQIWFDDVPDGVYNTGDDRPVPAGVAVELWPVGATDPTQTVLTNSDGQYLFTDLDAGDYYIVLQASNFASGGPLENYVLTDGAGASTTPGDGTDSDSNGEDLSGVVRTSVFTLSGATPTGEVDPFVTVPDDRVSDLTIDIGLIEVVLADTGIELRDYLVWMAGFLAAGLALLSLDAATRSTTRRRHSH